MIFRVSCPYLSKVTSEQHDRIYRTQPCVRDTTGRAVIGVSKLLPCELTEHTIGGFGITMDTYGRSSFDGCLWINGVSSLWFSRYPGGVWLYSITKNMCRPMLFSFLLFLNHDCSILQTCFRVERSKAFLACDEIVLRRKKVGAENVNPPKTHRTSEASKKLCLITYLQ